MSITTITTGETISALQQNLSSITIGTANGPTESTILGSDSLTTNDGTLNTSVGLEAGRYSHTLDKSILMGYRAGYLSNGARNTYIGNLSGMSNVSGDNNTYVGMGIGESVSPNSISSANVMLGNYVAAQVTLIGRNNVFIGHSNTAQSEALLPEAIKDNNVSVGAHGSVVGERVTSVGFSNKVLKSDDAVAVGPGHNVASAPRSVVIGTDIVNTGSDAVIIKPTRRGAYTNSADDHLNVKGVLLGNRIGTVNAGSYATLLTGDDVTLRSRSSSSCNYAIVGSDGVRVFSDDFVHISSPLTSLTGNEVQIDNLVVNRESQTKGRATFDSNIKILSADGGSNYWMQYVNTSNELVFESKYGTTMTLVDAFRPEGLNFTGKHRCCFVDQSLMPDSEQDDSRSALCSSLLGQIVIATGSYRDLDGRRGLYPATNMDEAVPVVSVCRNALDKRVFGVIGGLQRAGADGSSSFQIGNAAFKRKPLDRRDARESREGLSYELHRRARENDVDAIDVDTAFIGFDGDVEGDADTETNVSGTNDRLIVQSVGEGMIRVCDDNGDIENGDFLTSSFSRPGHAMRQSSACRMNYTVARATCDFAFGRARGLDGRLLHTALIGCVYCC